MIVHELNWNTNRKGRRKQLTCFVLFGIFSLSNWSQSALAQNSNQNPFQGMLSDLEQLEQRYQRPGDPAAPLVNRLELLEQHLCGGPRQGSMVQRIQYLRSNPNLGSAQPAQGNGSRQSPPWQTPSTNSRNPQFQPAPQPAQNPSWQQPSATSQNPQWQSPSQTGQGQPWQSPGQADQNPQWQAPPQASQNPQLQTPPQTSQSAQRQAHPQASQNPQGQAPSQLGQNPQGQAPSQPGQNPQWQVPFQTGQNSRWQEHPQASQNPQWQVLPQTGQNSQWQAPPQPGQNPPWQTPLGQKTFNPANQNATSNTTPNSVSSAQQDGPRAQDWPVGAYSGQGWSPPAGNKTPSSPQTSFSQFPQNRQSWPPTTAPSRKDAQGKQNAHPTAISGANSQQRRAAANSAQNLPGALNDQAPLSASASAIGAQERPLIAPQSQSTIFNPTQANLAGARRNFNNDGLPLLNAFPPTIVRMEADKTGLVARPDYYNEVLKASKGKTLRFKAMPIPVYIQNYPDRGFMNCVLRAFEDWEGRSNGTVRFSQIDNPNQARIQVVWKHLGGKSDSNGCLLGAHTILKWKNNGGGSLSMMSVGAVPVPIYIPRLGPKYSVPPQVIEVNLDLIMQKEAGIRYQCLQNIVAHELGHALGLLGHSPNEADMMHPITDEHSRLSERDLNTINRLYKQKIDIPL